MSKSRGNVVEPWEVIDRHGADAFRWYYFTSQQPWAGYRFSRRDGRRGGAPVPADALEHLLVLGALREHRGTRAPTSRSSGPRLRTRHPATPARRPTRRARPLGALAAAGRRSRRSASAWTTSTAPPPAGRSPPTSTSSPTGTCASAAAASGRATMPPSRPCATAWSRSAKLLAPFTPFLADEIYGNLVGGADERLRRRSPTRSTSATSPSRSRALVDAELEARDGGGPPHGRARPRGPRPGQGEDAPAAAQGGGRRLRRRARGDRAARRRSSPRS